MIFLWRRFQHVYPSYCSKFLIREVIQKRDFWTPVCGGSKQKYFFENFQLPIQEFRVIRDTHVESDTIKISFCFCLKKEWTTNVGNWSFKRKHTPAKRTFFFEVLTNRVELVYPSMSNVVIFKASIWEIITLLNLFKQNHHKILFKRKHIPGSGIRAEGRPHFTAPWEGVAPPPRRASKPGGGGRFFLPPAVKKGKKKKNLRR